jgi:hypothetical protein
MAADNASIALSWPNIVSFKLRSRFLSTSRSDTDTFFGGMRAMRATTFSICVTVTEGAILDRLQRRLAPASSTTSMALSGMCRSLMCRAASSAAARSASSSYLMP